MDSHSFKVLEFGSIVDLLRERTACALGEAVAHNLEPSASLAIVREWQGETTEACTLLREDGNLPLGGIHDIGPLVRKAAMDAMLQPAELLDICETLSSGRRLRAFLTKRAAKAPKLNNIAQNIRQFQTVEDAIKAAIDDNSEVRSSASPELARIRAKLKSTHSRLVDRLHSIIQSAEFRTMIQDPVVTQRGDRYCVPVKAEYRSAFHGIVHDSSASGATVFMEPASVVDMGNDIKELTAKEEEEVAKVLRRLTGLVRIQAGDVQIMLSALGRLDFISAKARLSEDMDATEPILNREGKLEMRRARHPLLTGDVVPIDVQLGRRFNALLITGPNTGGKTVTLKTVGLLTIMAQCGLHVPVDSGSEMAVFDNVFADIGDEQSIQQSLSTFSSHMRNIVGILDGVGSNVERAGRPRSQSEPQSLVLLDEVGAGTDPAEGAALAQAIVDRLVECGARVVATTHYGELKEYAFTRDGVENASVEFDVQTLRPTYRLMIGVPGSSNAFAIASRLGLPENVIELAKSSMKGGGESDEIIRKIEASHRVASEREQMAQRTSRDADSLKARYEAQIEEVESLRRDMRQKIAQEIDLRVRERMEELDEILNQMKQDGLAQKDVQAGRELFKEAVKEIRQEAEEMLPETIEEPLTSGPLKSGDMVRVPSFGVEGILLNDPGSGDAVIQAGSLKISVPFEGVRLVRRIKAGKSAVRREGSGEISRLATAKTATASPELNIIAQRVEGALENLDKYLDNAWLAGMESVRIIHGKGTGALKRAVWDFLKDHYAVASFRLGEQSEGGSGATVVTLKSGR
jgi:DNA mismatch repair protein MutS2